MITEKISIDNWIWLENLRCSLEMKGYEVKEIDDLILGFKNMFNHFHLNQELEGSL